MEGGGMKRKKGKKWAGDERGGRRMNVKPLMNMTYTHGMYVPGNV